MATDRPSAGDYMADSAKRAVDAAMRGVKAHQVGAIPPSPPERPAPDGASEGVHPSPEA